MSELKEHLHMIAVPNTANTHPIMNNNTSEPAVTDVVSAPKKILVSDTNVSSFSEGQ